MLRNLLLYSMLMTTAAGAQQKRIYIAPDDHTDYMWSGNEEEYRQAFVEMIDYYLDLADKTAEQSAGAPEPLALRRHALVLDLRAQQTGGRFRAADRTSTRRAHQCYR